LFRIEIVQEVLHPAIICRRARWSRRRRYRTLKELMRFLVN
jgi:hypothetical protein